jgi:hypothetical protein
VNRTAVIRRTACRLGAIALISPAVIGLTAGAALAAGISSPEDGTVYSSPTTVTASGSFAGCSSIATSCPSGTLTVTDPTGGTAGSTSKTASRGTSSTTISLSVDTGGASALPNGTWTVTLKSGSSTSTSRYYTNFAPATPSGFAASTADGDAHEVFLTWNKGSEPDLQSYTVYDGNGNVLQNAIDAGSACSGSSCQYTLYYDNPKPGSYTYSYELSVSRSGGCPSSPCPTLESDKTGATSATLTTPKPPPPSPTPAPTAAGGTTTGGSTGGTTGGSTSTTSGGSTSGSTSGSGTTGGASSATTGAKTGSSPIPLPTLDPGIQKRAFALNFSNFSAGLGIPKLPPLPRTTITLPGGGEGAVPQGTYQPTLPYKAATETTHSHSIVTNPIGSITSIDNEKLAKCLAFALILIMCAAHLRRWVGAHVED